MFPIQSHFMLSYSAYCASEEARAEWLRKKRKKAPFEAFLIVYHFYPYFSFSFFSFLFYLFYSLNLLLSF